jgi:hypothetical protein
MHIIRLSFFLILLAGCAQPREPLHTYNANTAPTNMVEIDPNSLYDLDELLSFSEKMSNMNPSARNEQCKSLLKYQSESNGTGILLHIMIGRLLSDTCGDVAKLLESIAAINHEQITDAKVAKLISIDTEILKRQLNISKKLVAQERKQKSMQNVLDSKATSTSKKDESQLLREKLEAIRTMEKQFDETSETN